MADDAGLTVSEVAEIVLLQSGIRKLCAAAASRELQAGRPELAGLMEQAEAELAAAEQRLEAPRAALEPLERDLETVRAKLAEHRQVDESAPLDARLRARRELAALADEESELVARAGLVRDLLSPALADVNVARMAAGKARSRVEGLDIAAASPLDTSAGLATQGGISYMLSTGAWAGHLDESGRNTVMGRASRKLVADVLRESGIGAEIEQRMLDHQNLVQQRKDGVVIGKDGVVIQSARGWDGSGAEPSNIQYSQASASGELAQTHWQSGFQPSPGLPVADISGMPSEFAP